MNNKNVIVKQRDIRDCGPCCLASIIKYYNGYVPIEKIRQDSHTDITGTTAYHLIKSANKYGFDGKGIKINFEELKLMSSSFPVIAHLILQNKSTHYVVIYKINRNKITIMDPAKGMYKISKEEFEKIWTNVIIVLHPRTNILVLPKSKSVFSLFINIIKKEKKLFFSIVTTSILLILFSIISSYYLKFAMDLIERNAKESIYVLISIFTLITIIKVFVTYRKNKYEIYLNKNIDCYVTVPFLNHLFNLPLKVIKSRSSGEIITRVNELENIKNLFTEIVLSVLLDLILALSTFIFLYIINKELFLLLCLIILIYTIISIVFSPIIYKKINDNIELETEYNSHLVEDIDNIESIKNLHITPDTKEKLEISFIKYVRDSYKFQKFINYQKGIQNFIVEIGLITITSIGLIMIINNKLTLLDLITFNTLITYFFDPLKNIINILPKYNFIKASFDKISEFINLEEEKINIEDKSISGDIVIDNLSYSYNNFDYNIHSFNAKIKENTHVFIKGPSGSGKSTICKLLMRYDDNYKGNILIGGVNILDYNINTIRNNITYVSQNEKLFTGTIKENLCLNDEISDIELNRIINICQIEEILANKPLRLDTQLYDNGSNLSGGQRQRIILARALLQNKKILILDESLNEVEKDKEIKIIKNIRKEFKNKTIIYISHRNISDIFDQSIEIGKEDGIL